MAKMLGFVDKIERDAWHTRARIELVELAAMEAAARDPRAVDRYLPDLDSAETLIVTAKGREAKAILDGMAGQRLEEGQWLSLDGGTLSGIEGLSSYRYLGLEPSDGERPEPALPNFSVNTEPFRYDRALASFVSRAATEGFVRGIFSRQPAATAASDMALAAYAVGQGAATALVDFDNIPQLYFDLGGGCDWNASTYPRTQRHTLCWCANPPIVISHLDWDHIFSAVLDGRSRARHWVFPKTLKPGTRWPKLVADILAAGGSLTEVDTTTPFFFGPLTFVRPDPSADSKNNSGIVMVFDNPRQVQPRRVLVPADAGYCFVRKAAPLLGLMNRLDGLVAAHHGSGRYTSMPPAATGAASVLYSAGWQNTYGHPSAIALQNHRNAGWSIPRHTHSAIGTGTNWVFDSTPLRVGRSGCRCNPRTTLIPNAYC